MIKVELEEKYIKLFDEYSHSLPLIYSCLEGQYIGDLYVDDESNPNIALLFTPFAFHFVAGNSEIENNVELLDDLIFGKYLKLSNQKEAIVFAPNSAWDAILDEIFKQHNGISDNRKIYRLNKQTYHDQKRKNTIKSEIERKLIYEQDMGSNIQYPVSRIYLNGACVSFCSGFMLGKMEAEIDIGTNEKHRKKGYAKEAAFALIDELISKGIEPNWCTWPYRIGSQKLALSLGFELAKEVPAHIWVEAECGILD